MFGLNLLTKAIAALTGNLTALSSTVAEINSGLRGRLLMDHAEEPVVLPHRTEAETVATEPTRNGKRTRQNTATE